MKTITIQIGRARIAAEVAESYFRKALGLMFRKSLKQGTGMLFDFSKEQKPGMWMFGMSFPIDIIYISNSNRIVDLKENCKPWALKIFEPRMPARYVIEVPAGFCSKNSLMAGQSVYFLGK